MKSGDAKRNKSQRMAQCEGGNKRVVWFGAHVRLGGADEESFLEYLMQRTKMTKLRALSKHSRKARVVAPRDTEKKDPFSATRETPNK